MKKEQIFKDKLRQYLHKCDDFKNSSAAGIEYFILNCLTVRQIIISKKLDNEYKNLLKSKNKKPINHFLNMVQSFFYGGGNNLLSNETELKILKLMLIY